MNPARRWMKSSYRSSDERSRQHAVKDPCINICAFEQDVCVGCGRTKQEIRRWKKLDKPERRAVLAEADLRLLALQATGRRKR